MSEKLRSQGPAGDPLGAIENVIVVDTGQTGVIVRKIGETTEEALSDSDRFIPDDNKEDNS